MEKKGYCKSVLLCNYFYPDAPVVGAVRAKNLINFLKRNDYNVESVNQEKSDFNVSFFITILKLIKYMIRILKMLLKKRYDYVILSAGPFIPLVITPIVSVLTSKQLIIDLRDPIYLSRDELNKNNGVRSIINKTLLAILEQIVILSADYVVNVTDELTYLYEKKYQKLSKTTFLTIRNGFDLKYFNDKSQRENEINKKITFGVAGKFRYYSEEDLEVLAEGLNKIQNIQKVVVQIGTNEYLDEKFEKTVDYITKPFSTYEELIIEMKSWDIAILNNRSVFALGTKLFDYISQNIPILAFVKTESAIAREIDQFSNGFIVKDADDISCAVSKLVKNSNCSLTNKIELRKKYAREYQFEKLRVRVLND
jgi:glycosyltransferase involved in cell wall biosynthesis